MSASTMVTAGIPASQKMSAHSQDGYAAPVHPDIGRKQPRSQVPKFLWIILRI
jgi:hypothetical protein